MRQGLLVLAATILASTAFAAAPPAKAKAKAAPAPVLAYVVPDGSPGEGCDAACLKTAVAKMHGRRGVKKASIEGTSLVLEIVPGVFRAADVIKGIDGMKVEMRVPYTGLEVHFVEGASFPPVSRLEGEVLIVELGTDVKKAIEAAINFKLSERLKCFGQLTGAQASEAILQRYEDEKRPPVTMIPFLAEADLDGDKRPDLFLRFDGMPEVVVFNLAGGLKAVPVSHDAVDVLPRCDSTPSRFVRAVPKQKVKCMGDKTHDGDAVERVQVNRSNELLLWSAGKFATCEPLGEGAMPAAPRPKEDPNKKKPEDEEW